MTHDEVFSDGTTSEKALQRPPPLYRKHIDRPALEKCLGHVSTWREYHHLLMCYMNTCHHDPLLLLTIFWLKDSWSYDYWLLFFPHAGAEKPSKQAETTQISKQGMCRSRFWGPEVASFIWSDFKRGLYAHFKIIDYYRTLGFKEAVALSDQYRLQLPVWASLTFRLLLTPFMLLHNAIIQSPNQMH